MSHSSRCDLNRNFEGHRVSAQQAFAPGSFKSVGSFTIFLLGLVCWILVCVYLFSVPNAIETDELMENEVWYRATSYGGDYNNEIGTSVGSPNLIGIGRKLKILLQSIILSAT